MPPAANARKKIADEPILKSPIARFVVLDQEIALTIATPNVPSTTKELAHPTKILTIEEIREDNVLPVMAAFRKTVFLFPACLVL
jgi:hypothetical protein